MKSQKLGLDEQYHNIQHCILNKTQSTTVLHQQYGDRYDLCLLFTELIDDVIIFEDSEDTLSIARQLLRFELANFAPFGFVAPLDYIDNIYVGEIIYAVEGLAIVKVESVKFPSYCFIATIVNRLNFGAKSVYELSGVTL